MGNRHQFIAEFQLIETLLFYIETTKTEIIELILSTKQP